MSGLRKTQVGARDLLELDPGGDWIIWTPERARIERDLHAMVQSFEPIPNAAGVACADWLKRQSLGNDNSTKTWLHVLDGRVDGFFACCGGNVQLADEAINELGVLHRPTVPAFVVAWIAKSALSAVPGIYLMNMAYAIAREAAAKMGLTVLALDARDAATADRVWLREPYAFRQAKSPRARLWIPLDPA